jgi:hypothetical protein
MMAPMAISQKPAQAIFGVARRQLQQRGRSEVEHGHLEEDDPEQQHVDAVRGERQVEPVGREQVHGRPAREDDAQRHDAAEQQRQHAGNGVPAHQFLGVGVELQPGSRADAVSRSHLRAPYFT